jgi:hypothetical protein
MKKSYYSPVHPGKSFTQVLVEEYQINNPTSSEDAYEKSGEGQLTIKLSFVSNDYSPEKYKLFLEKFNDFLTEYSCLNK